MFDIDSWVSLDRYIFIPLIFRLTLKILDTLHERGALF